MDLWASRFSEPMDKLVKEFTSSINIDNKLYKYDIAGSIAHAKMLSQCGIIKKKEAERITQALEEIKKDIEKGKVDFSQKEDIHLAIEEELIKREGEIGEKLHTARSRNDQIALDERLYLREEISEIINLISIFQGTLLGIAEKNLKVIMPGYTHLQYAQPIFFSHHLLAYFWMLERDRERLRDCYGRVNVMPLGAGALAGTSLPIDREYVAKLLNFPKISENSLDTVGDRDYIMEFLSDVSLLMMHLSRLSEDIILWSSPLFSFIEISDTFATGSSIMPQKKNPDIAELIRGKTGRVYGSLVSLLTSMKALPLSYNRDMQEDKPPLLESIEIVKTSLKLYPRMLDRMKINKENMRKAAEKGFFAATDLTDYLVEKDVSFRKAHQIVGTIVKECLKEGKSLQELSLENYQKYSSLFQKDVFERIKLESCVFNKESAGGTGKKSLAKQIKEARKKLEIAFSG
ncbi:MAG TPA: argininosuccinate lyase [Candidatus Aerophobetes bacterium]|uniref:Argininosuccinate lyase n=2 Tax=root TaxID=1 RepID=A0A7C1RQ92_UNCAE|nr:argininosuccinate lyase [Candidatus Aerophobetes bacterium]